MRPMLRDIRTAFRMLAKSAGATALSVISIALGIGLTVGLFSVADAMLLRPMPFHQPEKLLRVDSRGDDGRVMLYGWLDYLDMSEAGRGSVELAAYQRRGLSLLVGDHTERLSASPVTANYFSLLGVRALLGRASVDSAQGRPQAVLGYRVWRRTFAGDPSIVGRSVMLRRRAFVVAGVMPEDFKGLARGMGEDVWVSSEAWFTTLGNDVERHSRSGQFEMIARLKAGVSASRAAAVLDASIRGAGKHKAAPAGVTGTSLAASYALRWSESLTVGGGLVLALMLVLFVACANVAQMRLAQAEWRRKELGVRMALGAGAWRVSRQLLVEAAMVVAAGGSLGVLLARLLMVKVAEFIAAGDASVDYGIRLDGRVLAFSLAAMALSVLFSGLGPARHAVKLSIWEVLKSAQGSTGSHLAWQKKLMAVGQVAVSVALFGTAALFLGSLRNAVSVHPGMDPRKPLLVMTVGPGAQMDRAEWCEEACDRLPSVGGVRGATCARRLPLSASGGGMTARVEVPGLAPMGVLLNNVCGNYFSLMGTRVVAGRGIDSGDRAGGAMVMVVSQTFARQVFAGRNPLGEWVTVDGKPRQVVGVAEDGPSNYLHEKPQPFLYLPYAQAPSDDITLMVETIGEPAALARALSAELKRFDPRSTVYTTGTLRQQMDEALSEDRMLASLAGTGAVFGVLLTAAGLFGVLQYTVSRRTRELGLRMALGAMPGEIQALVLRE